MNRTLTFRILIITLALILLVGLLLLVDFRAAYSGTAKNAMASRANLGTLPANEALKLYVWIEEKDRLSTQMRDDLMAELSATGRFTPQLLPTPKPTAKDFPILRVWIERPGYSWTPVYAQADMQVRWAFSSFNSEVSFEDDEPFNLTNANGPALMARGTINLRDRTTGLVSLPGYWGYLAQQAAKAVAGELVGQVQ